MTSRMKTSKHFKLKMMIKNYKLLSLVTLVLFFGSCSQEYPQSSLNQVSQEGHEPAAGRISFDLQAEISRDRGSEARVMNFDETEVSYKYQAYPAISGYNGGKTFRTHAFLYAYDDATTSYELVGYTKLSWAMTSSPGSSGPVSMKVKESVPMQKANLSSDKSRVEISTTETVSITQGKTYRLLAINDDGGFDLNKPNAVEYPEGAAPMFYFARGGNSPLELGTLRLGQGQGLVAYVMEMDFQAVETDVVTQKSTGGRLARFFPASPLLQVNMMFTTIGLEGVTEGLVVESILKGGGVALASSALTQNFGYTITGVGKPGERPTFTTVLKRLEAKLYQNSQSPLYQTTYERLLYPMPSSQALQQLRDAPLTFYLPLEPRFKQLSTIADQGSFVLADGSTVSAPLVAEGRLGFMAYLTIGSGEAINANPRYVIPAPPDWGYGVYQATSEVKAAFFTQTNPGTSIQRYQFAPGKMIRTDQQAIEYYWRNLRGASGTRSSLNRLDLSISVVATAVSNIL